MNKLAFVLAAATIVGGSFYSPSSAQAQGGHRQYYGNWQSHSGGYAYRAYYYKPTNNYTGYKHHYVIHHPKDPSHHYFYNPYTKKYWGRCSVNYGEKPGYSMLAEKDRQADIDKIPEAAFPPPGSLPPVPESGDGIKLDLPPDDLPDISALPGSQKR